MARWRRRRERRRKTIRWLIDSQGLTKASCLWAIFTATPLFGGSEERRFSLFRASYRFDLVGLGLKGPPRASATRAAMDDREI